MTPTARLNGPADLVAAVPHLLGFTPTDSVVITATRAKAVLVTARLDATDATDAGLEAALRPMLNAGADSAAIIVYGETLAGAETAARYAADTAEVNGLTILDAIGVAGGRYRSALCRSATCCPTDGAPVPAETASTTALRVEGSAPAASRSALAHDLDPATEEVPAHPAVEHLTPRGDDYTRRDLWLARAAAVTATATAGMTEAAAAARTLPAGHPDRLHVLACYAAAALLAGNGGRANVALDLIEHEAAAAGIEPPTLAGLLSTFSGFGLPPAVLAESFRQAGKDIRADILAGN